MIIYKSFYNIDIRNSSIKGIAIPEDFVFFDEYIDFAVQNENIKQYAIRNDNTTVVHCISCIVSLLSQGENISSNCDEQIKQYARGIADKLLAEEQNVQQDIEHLRSQIKKGNLLMVVDKNEDDEYLFLIAKVDNSIWYDSDSLTKNYGFSGEKKNIWKSAAFSLIVNHGEVSFDAVKVYVDTDAKYWATRFLELTEQRNDHTNTHAAVNYMDISLKRTVKKISEKDYYLLRNSMIQRFKVPHLVNYAELVSELLDGYVPEEPALNIDKVRNSLLELPEKKKFDTQFYADPTAVSNRSYTKFTVNEGIELRVSDELTNIDQYICSKDDGNGRRFLEIECQDDKTFKFFKERDTATV
ncbi:MAG: hypothetical protein SO471_14160 [Anaerobutyricum hallii]|uniref:hypothetical protein n=1 Tax=Anaerobutyricum hallii TaxID=39488 RepID=UPI002A821E12|nr:hypothetical protein [Anaerobutyricum hallii]MDY4579059.1 hypothetical protein [Anaerobutyricum hallii]